MYYQQSSKTPPVLAPKRRRPRTLVEFALRSIVAHGLRVGPHALPQELVRRIIARRFPPIHPALRTVKPVSYPHMIINDDTERLTSIAYAPTQHAYMNLISPARDNARAVVHVLDSDQDRMLNRILLDYVVRTRLAYIDIKANPYID